MVRVTKFKGTLSNPQLASELASRPYDTISRKEALELSGGIDHSYYHVIRPEINLPTTVDEHDPQVYKLGKTNLDKFIRLGYLQQDNESRFYAYEIQYQGYRSIGFFLLARVQDYEQGVIKKHELTRKDKEQDRTKLIDIQNANAEPVLLTYPEIDTIEEFLDKISYTQPQVHAHSKDDDSTHKVWQLSQEQSQYIQDQFEQRVDSLYIADGHHRVAASTNVAQQRREAAFQQGINLTGEEPYEFILSYTVSFRNINIMPYNRVIRSIGNMSKNDLLLKLGVSFEVKQIAESECNPKERGQYSLFIDDEWYRLVPRGECLAGIPAKVDQRLDVAVLQRLCIEPIFGIKDIRVDQNIEFVGGILGAMGVRERCKSNGCAVGIACYPVSINEIKEISDNKLIMLPKSTWIIPKPRSGLLVRLF